MTNKTKITLSIVMSILLFASVGCDKLLLPFKQKATAPKTTQATDSKNTEAAIGGESQVGFDVPSAIKQVFANDANVNYKTTATTTFVKNADAITKAVSKSFDVQVPTGFDKSGNQYQLAYEYADKGDYSVSTPFTNLADAIIFDNDKSKMFQQLNFTLTGKDAKDLKVYWGADVESTISAFNSKIDMAKVKTAISQGVTSYLANGPYGDPINADLGTNLLMEVNTSSSSDESNIKYAQLDITIQYSEDYTK